MRLSAARYTLILAPYLVLLLFAGDATFRTHDTSGVVFDWQVLTKVAIWLGALAIGVYFVPRYWRMLFQTGPLLLLLFVLWCILSAVYSTNPSVSLGMSISMLGVAMLMPALLDGVSEKAVIYTLLAACISFVVISLSVSVLIPGFGSLEYINEAGVTDNRLGGIAHPNVVGRTATIAAGLSIIGFMRGILKAWFMTAAVVATIVILTITESRTPAGALLISLLLIFLRSRSAATAAFVSAAGLLLLSLTAIMFLESPDLVNRLLGLLSRSGDIEEVLSLTGRVHVWVASVEEILRSPFKGYGYGMSSEFFSSHYVGPTLWVPPNSHNVYLEVLLSVGVIGMALLLMLMAKSVINYFREPDLLADFLFFYITAQGLLTAQPFSGVPTGLTLLFFLSIFWRASRSPSRLKAFSLHIRKTATTRSAATLS